jgi:replicative DNA helicase
MLNESFEAPEQVQVAEFTHISTLVNRALGNQEITLSKFEKAKDLLSGFNAIDTITGGFTAGELIGVALRPGLGKTAFMLSMAYNMAVINNKSIAIFSPERSGEKIVKRMIESQTGHSIVQILDGKIKPGEREHAINAIRNISQAKLYIDDTRSLLVEDLIIRAHNLQTTTRVDAIIVDYLEMLTTNIHDNDCKQNESCNAVIALKKLAQELNIPIIFFSQLSPEQYYHKGLHPAFKYTPAFINENADTLMFINRPDFYHINEIEQKEKGLVEVTIAKNKHIKEPRMVYMKFIESIDKYSDIVQ